MALLVVTTLIVLTFVAAAFWLAPRTLPRAKVVSDTPDRPRSFGDDMAWIAADCENAEDVAVALGLDLHARPANWATGLGAVHDPETANDTVFITPPVDGRVFIVSQALPIPLGGRFIDNVTPLLCHLSGRFDGVAYIANFPLIDHFAWARCRAGNVTRAFATTEDGKVWDEGKLTPEERALGLKLFQVRGIRERSGDAGGELILQPTIGQILQVATAWRANPMSLDADDLPVGCGLLVPVPAAWRAACIKNRQAA